jgi:uncharacterized membrane protein YgdD (TMEM256/DUF423 family)
MRQNIEMRAFSLILAFLLVSVTCMPAVAANSNTIGYPESNLTTVQQNPQNVAVAAPAIIAVYALPAIGNVTLYVGGAISIAGIIYAAGEWYNNYIKDLIYQDAKRQGIPTSNHKTVTDNDQLGRRGDPESSKDYTPTGELNRRRYYDRTGNADMDIDYKHNDPAGSHTFPHRHNWNGINRGLPY